MPQKNTIKTYAENSFYHIYNRGVNKQKIFEDNQDYSVLLGYLKEVLTSPDNSKDIKYVIVDINGVSFKKIARKPKNFQDKIELLAYCLMPNHFHFLIRQNSKNDIEFFMRSIFTRYSMYFNKKYERVGPLFQGPYKAVLVTNDNYLLHLSRYIHLNPSEFTKDLVNTFSSYANYLELKNTPWLNTNFVLSFYNKQTLPEFKKTNNYKDFVENYQKDSQEILGNLSLD